MINYPGVLPLVGLSLAGFSTVTLAGFLFTYYFKARFLPALQQPALAEARDPRRMFRIECPSVLELGDPAGRFIAGTARLLNLSLGGLCFSSAMRLNEGEQIRLRLSASPERLIRIDGRIVWANQNPSESRYGLEIHTATESR